MRLRPKTARERQIEEWTPPRDEAHEFTLDDYHAVRNDLVAGKRFAELMREHGRMNFLAGVAIGLFLGAALLFAVGAWWTGGYAAFGSLCCVGLMATHRRIARIGR